jgi:hypothetical protein
MWAAPGDNRGMKQLWADAPGAYEHLDVLYGRRKIRKTERDDLAHFIDHGWLVWRNAIESDLIDAFANDIATYHEHPGMFMTTNHRNGSQKRVLSGSAPDRFESLFDLHVNLASSRAVAMHPLPVTASSPVMAGECPPSTPSTQRRRQKLDSSICYGKRISVCREDSSAPDNTRRH